LVRAVICTKSNITAVNNEEPVYTTDDAKKLKGRTNKREWAGTSGLPSIFAHGAFLLTRKEESEAEEN
jgi:hypothetical protein